MSLYRVFVVGCYHFLPGLQLGPPAGCVPRSAMRYILPFALGWGGVPRPPSRSGGTSPPPCWGPTTPPPPGRGTPNIPFYPWGEVPLRISSYPPPPGSSATSGPASVRSDIMNGLGEGAVGGGGNTVFGKHCECIAQKCTHLERLPPLASHLLLLSHCVLTQHEGQKKVSKQHD